MFIKWVVVCLMLSLGMVVMDGVLLGGLEFCGGGDEIVLYIFLS